MKQDLMTNISPSRPPFLTEFVITKVLANVSFNAEGLARELAGTNFIISVSMVRAVIKPLTSRSQGGRLTTEISKGHNVLTLFTLVKVDVNEKSERTV